MSPGFLNRPLLVALFVYFIVMGVTILGHASPRSSGICEKIPADSFNFDYVQQMISSENAPQSVEEFLCRLPDVYLSNFSLIFNSGSLQEGSFEAPRALLFDPSKKSSRLILSFNGSPDQIGYQSIEMIQESSIPGRFIDFGDLSFAQSNAGLEGGSIVKGRISTFSFGQLNKCLACHADPANRSMPPRPLFDAIPTWPTAYGSSLRFPQLIKDHEVQSFNAFKAAAKRHPRYRQLKGLDNKMVTKDFTFQTAIIEGRMALKNAELTEQLASINRPRVVSLIQNSPHYESYKYAIYAALKGCENLEGFLTERVRNFHSNHDFLTPLMQKPSFGSADIRQLSEYLVRESDNVKLDQHGKSSPEEFDVLFRDLLGNPSTFVRYENDLFLRSEEWSSPHQIGWLRYLMEGRLNPVDMRRWNMDADKSNYRFTNGPEFREFIDDPDIFAIADGLAKNDEDLSALLESDDESWQVCEPLQAASLRALTKSENSILQLAPPIPVVERGRQILLSKCSGCHSTGALGAPEIPFHIPSQFTQSSFFKRNGKDKVKAYIMDHEGKSYMPRFDTLLEMERRAIRAYINNL